MSLMFCVAALYVGQLWLKLWLACRYAASQKPGLNSSLRQDEATIVQPVLGGDPALEGTLAENLTRLPQARFLWLVDHDDALGRAACERLARRANAVAPDRVSIMECSAAPQGVNPKVHKLALALERIETAVFVVLDDDTRLSDAGLQALGRGLAGGATLATGLPRYFPAQGPYSSWLAEFVNSSAVLTYLPSLAFSEPLSIHGMCYAMRTTDARRLDVFTKIARCLTDDLALAVLLRREGLRIQQTVEPHDIATSVETFSQLWQILRRWFVFTRILLHELPWTERLAVLAAYGMPPLLLWTLCVGGLTSWSAFGVLVATLFLRELGLTFVRRAFLGREIARRGLVSLVLELGQPVLLLSACASNNLRWRSRTIRVQHASAFEYL
jgi:ceramide glucosyltransferase